MKRFIGFLTLCTTMAIGLGVAVVPTIKMSNGSADFSSSKEYVFKVSNRILEDGENSEGTNVTNEVSKDNVEDVIETFKTRLNSINISSYSIKSIGDESFSLVFKTDDGLYDDVIKYLTFNWSFMASTYADDTKDIITVGDDALTIHSNGTKKSDFFTSGNAAIEYKANNTYPFVTITLANNGDDFKKLYEAAKASSTEAGGNGATSIKNNNVLKAEGDEEKVTPNTNKIFVLNDWLSGFQIKDLVDNKKTSNLASSELKDHILFEMDATNPTNIYWNYDTAKPDNVENFKKIYFGGYDLLSNSDDSYYGKGVETVNLAYKKALIWMNMFNSTSYNYQVNFINSNYISDLGNVVNPLYEYLVYAGNVNMSSLLIGCLLAMVMILLTYVLNFGINGISGSIVTFGVPLIALAFFNILGVEFNIGAILGIVALTMIALFNSMTYFFKIKNEIYLGRNFKKAYQDGSRKSFWYTFDTSLIGIILGFTAYLIPNASISSFGILLVLGSALNFVGNCLLLRLVSWLVYNSQLINKKPQYIGLDSKFIPNLSQDEKPTYFNSFKAKTKKSTKIILGSVFGGLLVASLVGLIVFGSSGKMFNNSSNQQNSEIRIQQVVSNNTLTDNQVENYVSEIGNSINEHISNSVDGKEKFISSPSVSYYYYKYKNNNVEKREYYYVVDLGQAYNESSKVYYNPGNGFGSEPLEIKSAVEQYLADIVAMSNVTVSLDSIYLLDNYSYTNYSFIYLGIGLAICFAFFLIRFGFNKASIGLLLTLSSIIISVGVFSLIRVPGSSLISLGVLVLSVFVLLVADLFFASQKEKFKENKTLFKSDLTLRNSTYEESDLLVYNFLKTTALIASFTVISLLFAISVDKYLVLMMIVGIIISIPMFKYLNLNGQFICEKTFKYFVKNVHFSKKENNKKLNKKNDEGPEEAIFTGIND